MLRILASVGIFFLYLFLADYFGFLFHIIDILKTSQGSG